MQWLIGESTSPVLQGKGRLRRKFSELSMLHRIHKQPTTFPKAMVVNRKWSLWIQNSFQSCFKVAIVEFQRSAYFFRRFSFTYCSGYFHDFGSCFVPSWDSFTPSPVFCSVLCSSVPAYDFGFFTPSPVFRPSVPAYDFGFFTPSPVFRPRLLRPQRSYLRLRFLYSVPSVPPRFLYSVPSVPSVRNINLGLGFPPRRGFSEGRGSLSDGSPLPGTNEGF